MVTIGGIYAILTLGLNIQWGFAGLFNAGIAGFFAIGAYSAAILTTMPTDRHLGGYEMPYIVAALVAMVASGLIAWVIGKICLRLRSDYLAIATIGIAEIIRLVFKNEVWATNGHRGISEVPKPFEGLPQPWNDLAFLAIVGLIVLAVYLLSERAHKSPWGRVMTAIRENEPASHAAGKNIETFRMQGFVIGSMIMALAGAMMSHYLKFINPAVSEPIASTFLVWVMLIVGGSGNNKGAIIGAFLMWFIWSGTELVLSTIVQNIPPDLLSYLPADLSVRLAYVRIFMIGLLLQIFLQKYPSGIFPEKRPIAR